MIPRKFSEPIWQPVTKVSPIKLSGYREYIEPRRHISQNKGLFTHQKMNKHGRNLSHRSRSKIEDAVGWLVYLSQPKRAFNPKTMQPFKFRINFITLTLPVLQRHFDGTITASCLNQFLTEARSAFNMRNYVWRAEAQDIGNIHFHIISDTYMNAYVVRKIWNRCIEKLGYVSAYQQKFQNLTFGQYISLVDPNKTQNINVLRDRYRIGKSTNWTSPNTTDVHSTKHIKNLSAYLAKYVTKNSANTATTTAKMSRAEKSAAVYSLKARKLICRMWGLSQSLSRIQAPVFECGEKIDTLWNWLREHFSHRYFAHDHGAIMRVHMAEYANVFREFLTEIRDSIYDTFGYSPCKNADQIYYEHAFLDFVPPE